MASTWPREALEQLGRPLNKWDLCPVCGQPAAQHFYNGLRSGELICPQLSDRKMTAAEYAETVVPRNVSAPAAPTKRQPDALAGPRAYFDDE